MAIGEDALDAYRKALACDPMSAFGGVIAFNRPIGVELAEALHENFVEVLIAPGYEDGALEVLQQKEAIRILREEERRSPDPDERDAKRVLGGLLIQDRDGDPEPREMMEVVTKTQPSEEQWRDLLFAWTVVRHVRSNAIVIAKDGATLGIGAGQMSRVDSVRLAVEKCRDARGEEAGGPAGRLGDRLRRLLPLRRRARGGDRGRLHRRDPARRLQTRRRGDRGLRRRRRRDGLHQAPPLPPLAGRPATSFCFSLARRTWSQTSSGVSAASSSSLSPGEIRPSSSRLSSIQVEQRRPVLAVDEDRREVPDPVGLDQGQALEHLVEGAEAAGEDDEGAGVADEHQLAGEEVVEVAATRLA